MNRIQLIIGGARSGKSALAEQYASLSNLPVTYIATAQAFDQEMQQRISQHQASRPQHWQLIESPLSLAKSIESVINESAQGLCILVDCLTLWLSNSLCKKEQTGELSKAVTQQHGVNLTYWQQEKQQLLALLTNIKQQSLFTTKQVHIILVSNEVGHGIVPMGELSRQFVDQSGWLHQAIASIADDVEFVMAGLPLALKSSSLKSPTENNTETEH